MNHLIHELREALEDQRDLLTYVHSISGQEERLDVLQWAAMKATLVRLNDRTFNLLELIISERNES